MSGLQEQTRRGRPPLSKELVLVNEHLRKKSHDSSSETLSGREKPVPRPNSCDSDLELPQRDNFCALLSETGQTGDSGLQGPTFRDSIYEPDSADGSEEEEFIQDSSGSNPPEQLDEKQTIQDVSELSIQPNKDHLFARRYSDLKLVGSGQFAQIFSATDEETDEKVAIKIIKDDPAYVSAAQQEIKILKFLN